MTEVSNDDAKLGYYSPLDGMRLHVIDTDPMSVSANGWLEDLSKVEKYVMSDEAYEKREGTYRQWARKKREEDPTWTLQKEQQKLRNQRKSTNEGEVDVEDAIAAAREKTLTTYSSFERVASTPQLPVRTWPGSQTRLAHVAFGHSFELAPPAPV